jgi:hypothetical protein
MNVNRVAVRATGAGVLVAAVVGAVTSTATAGVSLAAAHTLHHHAYAAATVETSATGNKVELVDPGKSTYVPHVMRATAEQRTRARRLLRGVNRFCNTHTLGELKAAGWRAGDTREVAPTHYFNPDPAASGVNAANPRGALVYEGEIGGVMFNGHPLPHLGPIPRAHRHAGHGSMGGNPNVEMVHIYCTNDLTVKSVREAFTPNRQIGVLADTRILRDRIRPHVMDLNPRQLREVRALVRSYIGAPSSQPARARTTDVGPDPVLQAMRTEIRQGLMELDEPQLRHVWRQMRSY